MSAKSESLPIKNLVLDAGTQARVTLDQGVIKEYAEALEEAQITAKASAVTAGKSEKEWEEYFENPFPNIEVTRDPSGHLYPWDGFHRIFAHKAAGIKEVPSNVTEGTLRDAILASASANASHGVYRTQKDKRRAVLILLGDEEWVQWNDSEIARAAKVSDKLVSSLRKPTTIGSPTVRKVKRKGKTIEVDVSNTGKKTGKKSSRKPQTNGKPASDSSGSSKTERETDVALAKIVNIIGTPNAAEGGKLRRAIESGALKLSPKDIRAWAQTSPERIRKAHPLIVGNNWIPSRAFAFLDRELSATCKIEDLIHHAAARAGVFQVKIDGFHFTVESDKARKAAASQAPATQ